MSSKNSHSLLLGIKNGTPTLKNCLGVSYKLNILLPYKSQKYRDILKINGLQKIGMA
jgi:hypothetical protein